MLELSIAETHSWIIEVVRAAVSWIYSRQKTEARMINFTIKGERYRYFIGTFMIGLGTVQIKGKELGLTEIREHYNVCEYSGSLIIHDGLSKHFLGYDMRGSNIIIEHWSDDDITEKYWEMPLECVDPKQEKTE